MVMEVASGGTTPAHTQTQPTPHSHLFLPKPEFFPSPVYPCFVVGRACLVPPSAVAAHANPASHQP